jgi:hypothetical protein
MVSSFARMLDGGVGRRRELAEHLTCGSCGGHHAYPVTRPVADIHPLRTAEKSHEDDGGPGPVEAPTHQCRDCGFRWSTTASGPEGI